MTSEAATILAVFRARNLGSGGFIDFTDFGEAVVWEDGSVKGQRSRDALRFLIEEGYVKEMVAGLELTHKGATYGREVGKMEPQYWVVGATWGGHDDQAPTFIRRGYWFLGWSDVDAPDQAARRDQIRPGDRIAIKRMMGKGSTQIRITAVGIVTEIDKEDQCVYVKWLVSDLDRPVESRGCFKSIHGPFEAADPWIREVFHL